MTMNEVIEHVEGVKPSAFSDNDKYRWINTLEGMISEQVHGTEPVVYDLPADADMPLLVAAPYDDLYILYVMAMIDFHNREYNDYNNTMLMFQERLEQYKVWYIRRNGGSKAKGFRHVMG